MERKKIITLIVVSALSILAVSGFLTYQSVSAQSTGTNTQVPAQVNAARGPERGHDGMKGSISDEELAAALGIDLAKLQEAQAAAKAEAVNQAVSEGLITQKQADAYLGGDRIAMPGGSRWLYENGIDYDALLAKALGISTEDLAAARQKAEETRLANAVASGEITQEQADLMSGRKALFADEKFQASMQSAYEAAVQQAVQDGVITQAQADLILADGNVFSGRGNFGGPGGRHDRPGIPMPDATQTDTAN